MEEGIHGHRCHPAAGWQPFLALAFFFLTILSLYAQEPGSEPLSRMDRIIARLIEGHSAFAEGRYDEALSLYRSAREMGSRMGTMPELLRLVEERRALGEIDPVNTHRIGIIHVTRIGDQPDVTEAQKVIWHAYSGVVKRMIEVFTEGQWTLSFEEMEARSDWVEGSSLNPHNPDHLDLERYFLATEGRLDSYITLSNTVSPARGLARQYPLVNGVLYGPSRGLGLVNAETHGFGVLLHEFFHTVEWGTGISPAHGFEDEFRGAFPGWTGTSEWEYYQWHFATTLKNQDWTRLSFADRFRHLSPVPSEVHARVLDAYRGIPLVDRQRARGLAAEGLRQRDPQQGLELFKQALELSPYDPNALVGAIKLLRNQPAEANNLSDFKRRLGDVHLLKDTADFQPLQPLPPGLGLPLGRWWPDQLETTPAELEWDVSPYVTEAGVYRITFVYEAGWNALSTTAVSLWSDGRELARDEHPGRSGREHTGHIYTLALPVRDSGSPCMLRVQAAGVNGTDSRGWIWILRES
ncbi:MAG: hypothetical protein ABIJ86_13920 [Spirochaetota bacterium]